MKIRPLSQSIAFLLPDTEGAPAGGSSPAPAIPASASPTGMPIPTAPSPSSQPAVVVQPTPEPRVQQKGIISVKKAFGLEENPSKTISKASAELRRRSEKGTFLPVPKIKVKAPAPETAAPDAEEPAPGAAKPAEPTPAPAAPTKVKIGEKEMTAEEIVAHVAALEAKIGKPGEPKAEPAAPAPGKETPAPKANLTPEAQAAEDKRLDDEFIERTVASMPDALDQATWDKIVADGDVGAFNRLRVRDQLAVRKWIADTFNPILSDINKFRADAKGAVEMHQTVQKYQDEMDFYTAYPDLKPHKDVVRNVEKVLEEKYPEQWNSMDKQQRRAATAEAVQSLPGIQALITAAKTGTAAPAPGAPKPAAPKPKPPTGQVSGGGNAPGKAVDMTSPQYLMSRGKV